MVQISGKNSKSLWNVSRESHKNNTRLSPTLSKDEGLKDMRYDSLLQNATDIANSDSYFFAKCDSFISKCDSYYKLRQLITKTTVTTKCDVYYKL